ncbi:MAG: hypothetical protein HGA78_07625, partial [Nitrospirales bacterium]|nr:hypothetical protein [Nitrospirales bacterium]
MYLIGPEDLIREIAANERVSTLGVKAIPDMEKLLSILGGEVFEEPMVVLDAGERADTFLTLSIIKKLKKGVNVFVLSRRQDDQEFAIEVFRSGADDIFFYSDSDELAERLHTIYRGVKRHLGRSVAFVGTGTGATFLAVNVVWAIKQVYPDMDVCIVDYDHYKNDVAFRMGISDAQKMLTLQDLITEVYENRAFDLSSNLV